MTYAVVAALPGQGLLGLAVATSPPAIGARCPHLRGGVGAVATQAHTDPSLGPLALDLLAQGRDPDRAMAELATRPLFGARQVAIVDASGRVAVHTGGSTEPVRGHRVGNGVAVLGNHLVREGVLDAMISAWHGSDGKPFETRLLSAIVAGRNAGGDRSGARSSAMRVVTEAGVARTDLRVDWEPDPNCDAVQSLARLVELWTPLVEYYLRRPSEPDLGSWEEWALRGERS